MSLEVLYIREIIITMYFKWITTSITYNISTHLLLFLYVTNTSIDFFLYYISTNNGERKWQPTPVFLPGESHGQRSLVGYSPWGCKEVDMTEAETPILWPPHAKSWLIGKDSDAGRDWGQEEKEMTEDEMAGWHHWPDGPESEWTPGDGDGQGGLACCDSWGRKESDTTEWLNWTELSDLACMRACIY